MVWISKNLIVHEEDCTSCGRCVDLCPMDNLVMSPQGYPSVEHDECWYCSVCEEECPTGAIDLQLPYLVR